MAKWIKEKDCGDEMLRCENCNARVRLDHYSKAVGLLGYDYCPYCGTKMERPKEVAEVIARLDDRTNK